MKSFIIRRWLLVAGSCLTAMLAFAPMAMPRSDAGKAAIPVNYLKQIRPILAQHCFGCHGPDEAARKGKLRLDLQSEAFAERKHGHAIKPANLTGSLVWE